MRVIQLVVIPAALASTLALGLFAGHATALQDGGMPPTSSPAMLKAEEARELLGRVIGTWDIQGESFGPDGRSEFTLKGRCVWQWAMGGTFAIGDTMLSNGSAVLQEIDCFGFNDAAGTFPRLADLGVDPKSFGSAVTVAMAQRLVRRLEPTTKKERPLTDQEKAMIAKVFEPLADKSLIPKNMETVWEPAPTAEGDTGYKGRVGLYEAIFMDDELAEFLRNNPPSNEINKLAAKQGYLTMAQDGIVKVLEGLTSLEEVAATVYLPQI